MSATLSGRQRQRQTKPRPLPIAYRAFARNRSAHFLSPPRHDREPPPGSGRFRREIGLKHFFAQLRRNSRPAILHHNFEPSVGARQPNLYPPSVRLRLNRIDDQVRKNFAQRLFRRERENLFRGPLEFKPHIPPLRIVTKQNRRLIRQRHRRHPLPIHRRFGVSQQLRELRAHPIDLAHHQRRIASHVYRQVRIFQLHLQHRLHRTQRVSQVVRNIRRHLPQRRHPLPLRPFPFEAHFVLNQSRQVNHPRQLLAQKSQRRRRLPRQIRSGRRGFEQSDFFAILFQPYGGGVSQASRRLQSRKRTVRSQRNSHRRQPEFLSNPPFSL